MAVEIERKFLVRKHCWQAPNNGVRYRQGYLCLDPERTVRVRLAGEKGFVTVKGATEGGARAEFEYPIPLGDATEMLDNLCHRPLIDKIRYRIPFGSHLWEVDEFLAENTGLLLAEVELNAIDEQLQFPPWIGIEVTEDPRYYNAGLCQYPFCAWGAEPG